MRKKAVPVLAVSVLGLLTSAPSPASDHSEELVERFLAAWCGDEPDHFKDLLTKDFAWSWRSGSAQSRAAFVKTWGSFRVEYPECSVDVEDHVIDQGESAERTEAVRLTFHGRHRSGRSVELPAMVFFQSRGERLAAGWAVQDDLGAMLQLGYSFSAPTPRTGRRR
ncbi:MAG: ester cyclase [Holophagales bacterium]|nr:ester cyclase [Holophagales bacterium]MYF94035.1 ester cyclase [Holophagales bacterium]